MRLQLGSTLVVIAACGGPIPTAETPAQASASAVPDASISSDAGPPAPFHTITVAACARDREACRRARSSGGDATYRVSFGSSAGTLRSREQAIADLYREVRDRTALGTHLTAESHRLELPAKEAGASDQVSTRTSPIGLPGTDPLVDAAVELMDAVDANGEVTLDVSHGRASCKLSLGATTSDAGSRRCLIAEAARPSRFGSDGPRDREKKFGQ